MARSGIVWESDTLTPGLKEFHDKFEDRLTTFTAYQADKVQSYARTNAPWTDRTGNARGGLFAKAHSNAGNHTIVLYHTVPYGIWLEVRFSGRFAVIRPTIQKEGRRIMADLRTFMGSFR